MFWWILEAFNIKSEVSSFHGLGTGRCYAVIIVYCTFKFGGVMLALLAFLIAYNILLAELPAYQAKVANNWRIFLLR